MIPTSTLSPPNQTGGNGVLLSNYVANSVISENEFVHTGDNAIILLGSTNGVDGTGDTFPIYNTITHNLMHEVREFCW